VSSQCWQPAAGLCSWIDPALVSIPSHALASISSHILPPRLMARCSSGWPRQAGGSPEQGEVTVLAAGQHRSRSRGSRSFWTWTSWIVCSWIQVLDLYRSMSWIDTALCSWIDTANTMSLCFWIDTAGLCSWILVNGYCARQHSESRHCRSGHLCLRSDFWRNGPLPGEWVAGEWKDPLGSTVRIYRGDLLAVMTRRRGRKTRFSGAGYDAPSRTRRGVDVRSRAEGEC
jgi:hypothetical protein